VTGELSLLEQMVKDFVVPPDASAESVGARCHLAVASVVRQVSVFEMRSLPLARSTQVITCAAGAAVAGERCAAIREIAQVAITTLRTPDNFIAEGYLIIAKWQHDRLNIENGVLQNDIDQFRCSCNHFLRRGPSNCCHN
jgi:hypothetical protein